MLPDLRARYRVEEIAVFGSITHPQLENPAGDIDLLVSFSEPPASLPFVELENLLSDRLGSPVDLVLRNALKPPHRRPNPPKASFLYEGQVGVPGLRGRHARGH